MVFINTLLIPTPTITHQLTTLKQPTTIKTRCLTVDQVMSAEF